MDSSPEIASFVKRLCLIWGLLICCWAMLSANVPLLLKQILGSREAAEWQGVFTATTGLSGLILCTFLGYFSDKIGRIEMLVPWCIIYVIGSFGVIHSYWTQTVMGAWMARVGALSVPSTILYAYTSDCLSGPNLLQAHGYLGATFGVALLCGSLLSAGLSVYTGQLGIFIAVSVCSILATLLAATTQRLPPASPLSPGTTKLAQSFSAAVATVKRDGLLRCLCIAFGVLRAGHVNSMSMFVLWTNYRLGWQIWDTSIALGIMGFLATIWQIYGIKIINRYFPNHVHMCLIVTTGIHPFLMLCYGAVTTTHQMYFVAVLGSVSGISSSIFTAKITDLAREDGISGLALGFVGSIANALEIVCAMGFGHLLSWTISIYPPESWGAGIPYFVNAFFYLGGLFVLLYGHSKYGARREGWTMHYPESEQEVLPYEHKTEIDIADR